MVPTWATPRVLLGFRTNCTVITLKRLRACCGAHINILLRGNGKFISISTAYIKVADAILVCYDVRSEFDTIEEGFAFCGGVARGVLYGR